MRQPPRLLDPEPATPSIDPRVNGLLDYRSLLISLEVPEHASVPQPTQPQARFVPKRGKARLPPSGPKPGSQTQTQTQTRAF